MKKYDAIERFGSAAKLARALGLTRGSISQWGKTIPPLRAYQIEQLTNGKLKADAPLTHKH